MFFLFYSGSQFEAFLLSDFDIHGRVKPKNYLSEKAYQTSENVMLYTFYSCMLRPNDVRQF